jgi:hypothetical protein
LDRVFRPACYDEKSIVHRALLALILAASCFAATGPDSRSRPADPLTRAAEEFKVLTRDRGMRPDSPAAARKSSPVALWHGRVYENFRNDVLDAVPHEVTQNGGDKSVLRRNQFGFNVAGPALIPHFVHDPNAAFLLLSYEGVREHISRASLHTVPTVPERVGDFSQTVDQAGLPLPIYDPAATALNPLYAPAQPVSLTNLQYPRSPFPGNRIPESRLAPRIQDALKLYPLPNTAIGPFFQNNYFVNSTQADTADGFIVKLDRPFRERQRLTFSGNISNGFLGSAKFFPNHASPTPPDQHFATRRAEVDYVLTASSKTVYTASVTAASNSTSAGDASLPAFPRYRLGNYLSMGADHPQTRSARNTYELDAGVSTRQGKHSLQFAFQGDAHQVNALNPAYPSGNFQFSAGLTSLPGIIDTGAPFASFLLGLASYGERTVTVSPSYFRDPYANFSAKDKYEVSKSLNISAGLTLGVRSPRTEKYDRQSAIDAAAIDPSVGLAGALVFAGRGGVRRGLRPDNVDLDPSVSLAWNPFGNANTVVRAGFSRQHGKIPTYSSQWSTQGFNARQTFVSSNTQLSPAIDLGAGVPPLATPLPDLSPSAADNTTADYMDLTGREPVYQSASLSIEREIPFSMLLSIGASYSGGRDVLVGNSAANPNAISPDALRYGNALYDQDFHASLQPFPQYTGYNLSRVFPAGRYQRDAGFVRLEKRASFGLSFTATYQFSKQLDDYSAPYGEQDFFNRRNDWALSAFNPPQYVQVSYMYELPFGSGKPLLHFSDWRRPLVSGWSITGTAYWDGGHPLAVHPEFNNTGNVLATLNADVVAGVDPRVEDPGPERWFNPAAFAQPADFTVGNAPPTEPNLLGPGMTSLDLSVDKRLPLGERSLEFSASAFNFLNHANWNYPDTAIGPAAAPNVNAGRIIGSYGGRVVQLGLKFSF